MGGILRPLCPLQFHLCLDGSLLCREPHSIETALRQTTSSATVTPWPVPPMWIVGLAQPLPSQSPSQSTKGSPGPDSITVLLLLPLQPVSVCGSTREGDLCSRLISRLIAGTTNCFIRPDAEMKHPNWWSHGLGLLVIRTVLQGDAFLITGGPSERCKESCQQLLSIFCTLLCDVYIPWKLQVTCYWSTIRKQQEARRKAWLASFLYLPGPLPCVYASMGLRYATTGKRGRRAVCPETPAVTGLTLIRVQPNGVLCLFTYTCEHDQFPPHFAYHNTATWPPPPWYQLIPYHPVGLCLWPAACLGLGR